MTTTTTAPLTDVITTAHKRALRHADNIVFRLFEGQATIEAYKRADTSTTGFEEKVTINVGGSRVADYGDKTRHYPDAHEYTCFDSASTFSNQVIRTIVARLKIGGFANLIWTRDNNNEIIRAANMHMDSLNIVISGPEKDGKLPPADTYMVRATCTYDNSARMIRRA